MRPRGPLLVVLVALLLGLAVWGALGLGDRSDEAPREVGREAGEPGEAPGLIGSGEARTGGAPGIAGGATPEPSDAPGDEGGATNEPPGAATTGDPGAAGTAPPSGAEASAVAVFDGETPAGWADAPLAQRPHAIRPPRPRGPRFGPGAGPVGPGPTGHWTRFPPPPPPAGTASIRVEVVGSDGRPLPAADVWLGPRSALGSEGVSFGDLRKIGIAGEDGVLVAEHLPAGAAVVAGNVANQLNGPRGLDARSSVPVLLAADRRVVARLTLPLEASALGSVSGRVLDRKKRPIPAATVSAGYVRTTADAAGRFELPYVPAGTRSITASRTGYRPERREIEVPAGRGVEVTIELALRERGSLSLTGVVSGADAQPVEGATVYLIDEGGGGTLRSVKTDASGRYLFEDLPDRLRQARVRVQASAFRRGYPSVNVRLEDGIDDPTLDLLFPPRRGLLRVRLRDASSGAPVTRCRIELHRTDDPEIQVRGFLGSNAEGLFEHWYDVGPYRLRIEAPDHEAREVEARLVTPGDAVELAVDLVPRAEEAVQVTVELELLSTADESPVVRCRIEVLDAAEGREAVARFEGGARDGRYSMPAPSGTRVLRVGAEGFETLEKRVELPRDPPVYRETLHLRPE